MSNEETNELLREIRDLLLRREQKYDEYLEKSRRVYQKQLQDAQKRHWKNATIFALLIGTVFGLIFIAYKSSQ